MEGSKMYRKTLGVALIAMSLAACNKDEPVERADVQPPAVEKDVKADVTPVTDALPKATDEDMTATYSGGDLASALRPSENIGVEASDDIVTLSRIGDQPDQSVGKTTGAFITLANAQTSDFSGNTLIVTLSAKSASDKPTIFMAAYSTAVKGNSGWQTFEASTEFESFSFKYTIPDGQDKNPDFVGISVPEGSEVEIRSISVAPAM